MFLASLKPVFRDLASKALYLAGATRPARSALGRLTVVTFHRVLPAELRAQYPLGGLVATPEELGACLDFFARHFECGTLAAMAGKHRSGVPVARPLLAITFDDGQRDNFVHARTELESRNMRASFFVPIEAIDTGTLLWHDRLAYCVQAWVRGDPQTALRVLGLAHDLSPAVAAQSAVARAKALSAAHRLRWMSEIEGAGRGGSPPGWDGMMTWDQICEMHRAGHEIGSHSMTHPILPLCGDAELEIEVRESRDALARRLGAMPETFCYPNGDYDQRTLEMVKRAGYRWGVTTRPGLNAAGAAPLTLRRFDIDTGRTTSFSGRLDPAQLALRLSGLHPGMR